MAAPSLSGKVRLTFGGLKLAHSDSRRVSEMFEVAEYKHPFIYVKCRRTGETYKFMVVHDDALPYGEAHSDQADAFQAALAYLSYRERAA